MPEITITLTATGHARIAVATNMIQPSVGRPLSHSEALTLDILNTAKRHANCTGVQYGAALGETAGDKALELVNQLLNTEGFAHSVSPEVRNAARRVLSVKFREGLPA